MFVSAANSLIKISGLKETQCELPKKTWKDYSSIEIRRYWLRNLKNTDCSFIAEDEKDSKAAKVYKSFKWILCEISPVLKEILNDIENQAKNCKEIVVSNPNHIKAILFYGHTKVVYKKIMNLLDFYEASKEYQVKALEEDGIHMFNNSPEDQKKTNWVKLFWLSYVKYPEDQQIPKPVLQLLEQRGIGKRCTVKRHVNWTDKYVNANINLIMEFDEEKFDIFFDMIFSISGGLTCFKITEAYLIKHFFEGNKNKKLEEIDPLHRNLVECYINKMVLGNRLAWYDYKSVPLVSNFLTTDLKIEHLEIIEKKYNPRNSYDKMIFNEIQSYIQKLREGNRT